MSKLRLDHERTTIAITMSVVRSTAFEHTPQGYLRVAVAVEERAGVSIRIS